MLRTIASLVIPVVFLCTLVLVNACDAPDLNPIEKTTMSAHPAMLQVWHQPEAFEVQILFTEIDRTTAGTPHFTDHSFRLSDSLYFYPASTVKLPAAVLALERLSGLPTLSATTPYVLQGDSTNHSIASDVKQIFAVSDNAAYNRLYEWMGRDYMNEQLRSKGIQPVRLAHRLSTPNSDRSQRDTLLFKSASGDTLYTGADGALRKQTGLKKIKKGTAYIANGKRIEAPMDFSEKNYLPLSSLHALMKRLFFPEAFEPHERFQLSETNKTLLFESMKAVPRTLGYDETDYPDSFGKFFMYGDSKERIPEHIEIYNKVGYAYGTLTETAYIRDTQRDVEFLLSATILVNRNQTFNDDTYEFESVGIPFLAQLGRELYMYSLQQ